MHGMTYNLKATTDAVDPPPEFDWERRTTSGTSDGDFLQDGIRPSQTASDVRCTAAPVEDVRYVSLDYNVDNDKFIYVSADNDHPDASVGQFVKLDVQGKCFSHAYFALNVELNRCTLVSLHAEFMYHIPSYALK